MSEWLSLEQRERVADRLNSAILGVDAPEYAHRALDLTHMTHPTLRLLHCRGVAHPILCAR